MKHRRPALSLLVACTAAMVQPASAQVDLIFRSSYEDGECVGYACFQVACPGAGTTISGKVYAPNGTLPLPGVTVFVPNARLAAMPTDPTCDACGTPPSGNPLVSTTSAADGSFVLENAPATTGVPLVIQSGRWRRESTIPVVTACADNTAPAELTRLPRNPQEGDVPRIAVSTGAADSLECIVRKAGLDPAQFGIAGSPARVHLYAGSGGTDMFDAASGSQAFAASTTLWSTSTALRAYDIVMLSCEGAQNTAAKPPGSRQALKDYADAGGRVYASHWHNYWIQSGPDPWPALATWNFLADLGPVQADIVTSFPRGARLAGWLTAIGGTVPGKLPIVNGEHTVTAVDEARVRRWIHVDTTASMVPSVQYFSFNTPAEAVAGPHCGRVVFSELHSGSADTSSSSLAFPSGGCSSPVGTTSAEEKAVLYTLFDIGTCIAPGPE